MIAGARQINAAFDAVVEYSGFSRAELLGACRTAPVQFYRQLAMYMAHKHGGWGLVPTARYFGREHPSGLNAVSRIDKDHEAVELAETLWASACGPKPEGVT